MRDTFDNKFADIEFQDNYDEHDQNNQYHEDDYNRQPNMIDNTQDLDEAMRR